MKLKRYFGLGVRHFGILCRALVVVICARLALSFIRYRRISKWITLSSPRVKPSVSPFVMAWAVKHTSRLVPFATCLTQALALQYLLARSGYSGTIRVGVRSDQGEAIEAHAWVLWDETVLIGGSKEELDSFTPMVDLRPS